MIDQRACWQDQDTLLRTGSSDTTSDKHTGAMTSAWQAQKKERPKDRMIRRQLGVKRRWFLSHFSKNRKGDVSKDKEVVILSDEEEQAKSNTNVSAATSPITLEQISQLVVSG